MDIFAKYAPLYWAAGLSVIPLKPRDKLPILDGWQQFHDHLPTEEQQKSWLRQYTWHNMGLVLGRQSNIMIVDIDTPDQSIEEMIIKTLPPSPWCRIGAKGMCLAYRYNGNPTVRIKNSNGETLTELLSTRTQMVLPPSVHPNSDKYREQRQAQGLGDLIYTSNCELYEVLDKLVPLPLDIEDQLRAMLSTVADLESKASRFRISDKIPIGGRDVKMNQHAGLQATAVLRGEISVIRAISDMKAWFEEKIERSRGGQDDIDIEKGLSQIIQYILRDVNEKGRMLPTGWDEGMTAEQKKQWGLEFNDDQEEWKCDQLLDYIHKQFSAHGEDDPHRAACVEFVLTKMSKSTNLNVIETDRILQSLKHGTKLGLPTFKKRLAELQKGPIEGGNHTEIAEEAVKELAKRGFDLRYHNQLFWTWEGTHWAEMSEQKIWAILAREFGELPAAKKASDHKGIMQIMEQLVPQKIQTVELAGINFRNGFLTSELKLIKHNPDFGMTYTLPYNYDPSQSGKALMFEEFLFNCWGHREDYAETKEAVREAIAATLFGCAPAGQKAFLLYGVGKSGKSQLLNIVGALVPPEGMSAVNPNEWSDQYKLSSMDGKVLNICGELDEKKTLPAKMFKEVTDGSMITGQHKYKDPFSFRPKAAQWFATNFLPRSLDASYGFNRRWLIFLFDKTVDESKKIMDLGQIIVEQEMEAIVAWAVECFPDWMKRGAEYTQPKSHLALIDDMALQNSVIRQWMREAVEDMPGAKTKLKDLYTNCFSYCAVSGGGRPPNQKDFSNQFNQFLAEQGRHKTVVANGETYFMDIALKVKK